MKRLDKRESRVLAIGLLLAFIAIVYGFVVSPFISAYFDKADEIDELWYRIEKYQSTAETYKDVDKALERVKKMRPSQGNYLQGNTAALASANLQQYLTRVIEAATGKIISTQNVREESVGEATAVIIKVHMRGDLRSLTTTINRLEVGKPMLFIENLAVVATPPRKLPGSLAIESEQLDIQFNLVGYMLVEESK